MSEAAAANGKHVTRAEHEDLRAYVKRRFDDLEAKVDEQGTDTRFIARQVKLVGDAVELMLKTMGIDDDA